jgi:hypothetical protein
MAAVFAPHNYAQEPTFRLAFFPNTYLQDAMPLCYCRHPAVLPVHSARLLHSRTGLDDQGDASGYSSFSAARVINPASTPTPASRTAVTPLSIAAEATSNAVFGGAHRLVAPKQRRSYATVEPDPVTDNEKRRQVTVLPRQRSVQDLPVQRNILAGGSGESPSCCCVWWLSPAMHEVSCFVNGPFGTVLEAMHAVLVR